MIDEPLADTLNKAWKENKSGFGYKMLQRMGWSENKGLGKNEDGIKGILIIK
jgi:Pin2-interacting protein X1